MSGRPEPTIDEIDRLMVIVADAIRLHRDIDALPVFERLERERDRLTKQQATLQRAIALSTGSRTGCAGSR